MVEYSVELCSPPPPSLKTNSMPDTFTFSFDHNFSCTAQFKDEGFAVSFSLKKENTNIKTSFEAWGTSLIWFVGGSTERTRDWRNWIGTARVRKRSARAHALSPTSRTEPIPIGRLFHPITPPTTHNGHYWLSDSLDSRLCTPGLAFITTQKVLRRRNHVLPAIFFEFRRDRINLKSLAAAAREALRNHWDIDAQ